MESLTIARVIHGSFVHSVSATQLEYVHQGLIVINPHGVIDHFVKEIAADKVPEFLRGKHVPREVDVVYLARGEFVIPGFIDTHTHAVQYPNLGLGQQYELLDWLKKVTFPKEKRFADPLYAQKTFENIVGRLISVGTTTACYYSSLHLEASKILASICHNRGQRAFVGKCNMDRNAVPDYQDKSASQSLEDTKLLIQHIRTECVTSPTSKRSKEVPPKSPPSSNSSSSLSNYGPISGSTNKTRGGSMIQRTATPEALDSLVQPIVTPRFAICCTDTLLTGLSALVSSDPTLHIQTHLAENPAEITFTKSLFPFADSYAAVYDHFNLLTPRTVLAHCVHLEPSEMELIASRGSGIAHCPTSNFNLRSGASPVGELLDHGINVGLGTDVSGGFGVGILSAIREASVSAKVVAMAERDAKAEGRERSRGRSKTPMATKQVVRRKSVNENGNETLVEAEGTGISTLRISTPQGTVVSSSPVLKPTNAIEKPPQPSLQVGEEFADRQLSIATLFFLATLGGAKVCALSDKIGNFEEGKEFDALLVQTGQEGPEDESSEGGDARAGAEEVAKLRPVPYQNGSNPGMFVEPEDSLQDLVEKFLFTGDDRNIGTVFVRGRVIGGSRPL